MRAAPARRAPMMAASPTAPRPHTATLEPCANYVFSSFLARTSNLLHSRIVQHGAIASRDTATEQAHFVEWRSFIDLSTFLFSFTVFCETPHLSNANICTYGVLSESTTAHEVEELLAVAREA